jgi:rhodanese-related sulfurtransferase
MLQIKWLILPLILTSLNTKAQVFYKYDNKLYKAVYLNEAFRLMDSMQNFLLLDVRSPGEFADTSRATAINIGHLKGAVNITIDSVPSRLAELKKYADQPVFVYCSHSQRSRRVSKFLAENGFQKVYNVNGGMSVVNEYDNQQLPFKSKQLVTELNYSNIGPADAMQLIKNTPDLVIIDIRTEKEFNGKDSLIQNNIGHLKNAINIPQAVFSEKLDGYRISNQKPVLLYDLKGYNSMDVVEPLRARGFTRIYNLYEGLETFSAYHGPDEKSTRSLITDAPPYQILDSKTFIDILKTQTGPVIVDARPADEFNNKSPKVYLNLGHIQGAINILSPVAIGSVLQQKDPSTYFLVYGSNDANGMLICQELIKKGYRNVFYLGSGFYHLVWTTYNIEDCKAGRAFLVDHEGIY